MTRHLCLTLLVSLTMAADGPDAAPGEDAAAKDLAKLQGKWKLVETDSDGTVTKSDGDGHVIGIEKELMIGYDAEGGVAAKDSIKLDPAKSPKAMDLTCVFNVLFPGQKGKTYQVDKDELKLVFPYAPFRQRPKEFTTKEGSHFGVFTYKRVKP